MKLAALRQRLELDGHPLTLAGPAVAVAGADPAILLDRLAFRTARGEAVRAFWCRPAGNTAPLPAVLVIHAHGGRHDIGADELIHGRAELHAPPGPALAARGIASLCIDLPCFGGRNGTSESSAAKAALWEGRSLAGQMVGELKSALDWLAANPAVRADRIGVFGLSMGATLGYWLTATDPRPRALAHDCCLADFRALIALGGHDRHGIYLTVPGLLPIASNGEIAGMIAPRAQFVGLGLQDHLTPPAALEPALAELRAAYARAGGRLVLHVEPESGHRETEAMHVAMLDFMETELA